jgi:nickel-dependent lactate racemase
MISLTTEAHGKHGRKDEGKIVMATESTEGHGNINYKEIRRRYRYPVDFPWCP